MVRGHKPASDYNEDSMIQCLEKCVISYIRNLVIALESTHRRAHQILRVADSESILGRAGCVKQLRAIEH